MHLVRQPSTQPVHRKDSYTGERATPRKDPAHAEARGGADCQPVECGFAQGMVQVWESSVKHFSAHVAELWGKHWILPLLPAVYLLIMLVIGDARIEHGIGAVAIAAVGLYGRSSKQVLVTFAPLVIIGFASDALRYPLAWLATPDRIFACEIRALELSLFGLGPNTTISDFFFEHNAPVFDLLFAAPYGLFIYIAVAQVAYLAYTDRTQMLTYVWALLIAYSILFLIWLLVPVAPPWYVRAYGCTIDPNAMASAASLVRVDQMLNMSYFEEFYSRNTTIFGAMPSMHCAFPVLGLLVTWPAASMLTRAAHTAYSLLMIAASVYLDHHWLLDGIAGWLLALIAVVAARAAVRRRLKLPSRTQSASSYVTPA